MLKIGEFSKLSRISVRMLRHYDEIGILMPEMTDDLTGYRYYSEAQLPVVGRITALKDMGFSLATIAEIMGSYTDQEALKKYLIIKQQEVYEEHKESNVDVEVQRSVKGTYPNTKNVTFKTVEPILMASATYKGSYEQINEVNEAVANWVRDNDYAFDGLSFCIYHVSPYETQNPEELVTEVCYPVRKK